MIITSDEGLLDQALTAVAAAGQEALVVSDVGAAMASWPLASMVLVGIDQASEIVRRPHGTVPVRILGDRHDHPELCEFSGKLGAPVLVLPEQRPELTQALRDGDPNRTGRLVVTVGASGGLGCSSIAAGLGWRAARAGEPSCLVDLDPDGGGIDLLLGLEETPGWRWDDLAAVTGELTDLGRRLPQVDNLAVLAMSRRLEAATPSEGAVDAVLETCVREYGVVIVDLGRASRPEYPPLVLARAQQVLLTVGNDVRSVAAAGQVLARHRAAAWSLVVCAGPTQGLGAEAIADALEQPVVGEIPYDRALHIALQRGEPPGQVGSRRWRRAIDRIRSQL